MPPAALVMAAGPNPAMLFLINHRYPVLGAVLSALSNVVFLVLGIAEHSTFLILMSAPFLALSVVQFIYRRRQHSTQGK
jgi:uncharacterized membrane protein